VAEAGGGNARTGRCFTERTHTLLVALASGARRLRCGLPGGELGLLESASAIESSRWSSLMRRVRLSGVREEAETCALAREGSRDSSPLPSDSGGVQRGISPENDERTGETGGLAGASGEAESMGEARTVAPEAPVIHASTVGIWLARLRGWESAHTDVHDEST
jgi:hypothetical protein